MVMADDGENAVEGGGIEAESGEARRHVRPAAGGVSWRGDPGDAADFLLAGGESFPDIVEGGAEDQRDDELGGDFAFVDERIRFGDDHPRVDVDVSLGVPFGVLGGGFELGEEGEGGREGVKKYRRRWARLAREVGEWDGWHAKEGGEAPSSWCLPNGSEAVGNDFCEHPVLVGLDVAGADPFGDGVLEIVQGDPAGGADDDTFLVFRV